MSFPKAAVILFKIEFSESSNDPQSEGAPRESFGCVGLELSFLKAAPEEFRFEFFKSSG